ANRAIRLDPCSSVMPWALALVCWCGHRYDEAIEQCKNSLELDPGFTPAYWQLGVVYLNQHAFASAIAALQKAIELSPGAPVLIGHLAAAHAAAGELDAAQKIMNELDAHSKNRYVSPYLLARIHSALGDKDKTLYWLELGYERHAEWMVALKTEAAFDSLRSE